MSRKAIIHRHDNSKRRRVLLALGWYDYEINRGVAAFAQEANWILNDMAGHTHEIPLHWHCDGILVSLSRNPFASHAELLTRAVPMVDLRNEHEAALPRVLSDNAAVGRLAAEHFMSRGFTNLGYYQAYTATVEEERMAGFRETVERAGKVFYHIDMSRVPARHRRGQQRLRHLVKLIKELPPPIGVMGQYDGAAAEFVMACELARVAVPEQIAVIGADNDPITSELGPIPLSSVDTDRYRQGYEAAALLDRLMQGELPPAVPIRIPPKELVTRRSSNILAIENLHVSRGLGFIREHFCQPINIDDVAQAAGVSRRSLFLLFRQYLGRTVLDEINRLRIARARKLLAETDEKTYTVARECGYSNARHLNSNFQKEVGVTPTAYRGQYGGGIGDGQ